MKSITTEFKPNDVDYDETRIDTLNRHFEDLNQGNADGNHHNPHL